MGLWDLPQGTWRGTCPRRAPLQIAPFFPLAASNFPTLPIPTELNVSNFVPILFPDSFLEGVKHLFLLAPYKTMILSHSWIISSVSLALCNVVCGVCAAYQRWWRDVLMPLRTSRSNALTSKQSSTKKCTSWSGNTLLCISLSSTRWDLKNDAFLLPIFPPKWKTACFRKRCGLRCYVPESRRYSTLKWSYWPAASAFPTAANTKWSIKDTRDKQQPERCLTENTTWAVAVYRLLYRRSPSGIVMSERLN